MPVNLRASDSGLVLGKLFCRWFPYLAERPAAFAVVGMAAFFSAVVRAPVTGIILITEMTGCFTLLLPMLLACFAAMAVPTLLGDPPIYDSLRQPGTATKQSSR
jgi:CIC family chloride channel protein